MVSDFDLNVSTELCEVWARVKHHKEPQTGGERRAHVIEHSRHDTRADPVGSITPDLPFMAQEDFQQNRLDL